METYDIPSTSRFTITINTDENEDKGDDEDDMKNRFEDNVVVVRNPSGKSNRLNETSVLDTFVEI